MVKEKDTQSVYTTESGDKTTMGKALERVGIANGGDLKKVLGEAGKAVKSLDELNKKAEGLDPEDIRKLRETLQQRAEQDAEVIGKLFQVKAEIERFPEESSIYSEKHPQVQELIQKLRRQNPFAAKLADRKAKEISEERAKARQDAQREEVKGIREGTIPLHEALQNSPSEVACRVRLPIKDQTGKETSKIREGWIRLAISSVGNRSVGQVIKTTSSIRFLEKYGTTPEGKPNPVPLNPPKFWTRREEPFFPRVIREALADLYQFEERVHADQELTTGTVDQLLDGKAVRVVIHDPRWRESKDWNRPRSIKLDLEGNGKGNIYVHRVETDFGWQDLAGKSFSLTNLDRRLKRVLNIKAKRVAQEKSATETQETQPAQEK